MKFRVVDTAFDTYEPDTVYLFKDNWNDYGYCTTYCMKYCETTQSIDIGHLRIGEFNMTSDQRSPSLPSVFEKLNPEGFFSFSNNELYYNQISNMIKATIFWFV